MIDIIEMLLDKGLDILYYLAGEKGDGYNDLVKYINQKNLANHVKLLGEIDEEKKIKLMRECTIYLQISKYEAFGLAIAEAMACGAPVITSNAGELPNVIGDAGIMCENYLLTDIVSQVELLLIDRPLRDDLSKRAAKRIAENFQYSRRLLDIKQCLEKLVE
jgi:glycosyltransferase involved in cell wall biosynthesis